MDHIELLAESVIKLEIKQEPEDSVAEPVWNYTELEPPVAIFLQEDIKEEVEWDKEEEEEKEEVEGNMCGKDFNVGSEGRDRISGSLGTSKNVEPANQAKIENEPGKQVEIEVEVPKADPTSQVSTSNNLPYLQRKYTCSYCSKTFRLQCHLKTHIRTHTGSKPYSCPQCLSCFSQMAHLQKHMRAHSGERPHQCQVCNRAFKERYQLVTHQYTHSGHWPYRCPVCGKGFAFYTRLSKHAQLKHQGEEHLKGMYKGSSALIKPAKAHSTKPKLTNYSETALVSTASCPTASVCDGHFQHQLLQRPAVGLCDALAGGRDVCLRIEEASKPHMETLHKQVNSQNSAMNF